MHEYKGLDFFFSFFPPPTLWLQYKRLDHILRDGVDLADTELQPVAWIMVE
jgi:hypothetical protein